MKLRFPDSGRCRPRLCSPSRAAAARPTATPARSGPVDLRMTIWSANEAHLELFNEIAAEYKTDHPEVTEITFDSLPFESYTTTLTTQIAGGNAPDLAWILENTARDFVNSGALVPLDELEDAATSSPTYATQAVEKDGKLYAYPFSTSPFGVFVNTDLVKAAGQKTPAELIAAGEWTWDKAVATASAVQATTGKGGLVVARLRLQGLGQPGLDLGRLGRRPWSEDGKTCGFDQPADGRRDDVHPQGDLHRQGACPGPGIDDRLLRRRRGDDDHPDQPRASLLEGSQVRVGPGAAARRARRVSTPSIGQAGIGVLEDAARTPTRPPSSWPSSPTRRTRRSSRSSSRRRASRSSTPRRWPRPTRCSSPTSCRSVVIDGIQRGDVKPSHTGYAEMQQTVRAALDPLWKPDADVKAVLSGVCSKINPLLAK